MIHIGKLILQQVNAQGISKSELARRLNVSPQNVYNLLKRQTVQASLLKRISVALKFDFFLVYEELEKEKKLRRELLDKNSECYLEYEHLRMEFDRLQRENDYLRVLIGLSNEKNNKNPRVKVSQQAITQYKFRNTSIS